MRTLCLVLCLLTLAGCVDDGMAAGPPTVVPSPRASVGYVARDIDRTLAPRPVPSVRHAAAVRMVARPVSPRSSPRLISVPTVHARGLATSGGHARTVRGVASRMGSGFGRSYLALPEGPGHRVRICAKRCLTMTSTDAGPSKAMQRAGRVADLNDWAWAYVSGLPLSRGLCRVTVEYLR